MSQYQFLSSNTLLRTISLPQTELLSIEEVEALGGSMPNWYSKDMKISRTEKIVLFSPDEECFGEIQITDDDDSFGPDYARRYSSKNYHFTLHWRYSDKRAKELIAYIKEHLTDGAEIELWKIWLGDISLLDNEWIDEEWLEDEWLEDEWIGKKTVPIKKNTPVVIKRCSIDSLTISDINGFDQHRSVQPYCLVVYQ